MATERTTMYPNQEAAEAVEILQGARGAKLIVRLRKLYGLSQKELASEAELSQGYLSQVEKGEIITSPGHQTVVKLARVLGLGINFWENGLIDKRVFLGPLARFVYEVLQRSRATGLKMAMVAYIEAAIPELNQPQVSYVEQTLTDQSIGNKIFNLRAALGFVQREAAARANTSQGYYSQLEGRNQNRVTNPRINTLESIAVSLNIDIYDLLDLRFVEYPELIERVDRFFRNDQIPQETKKKVTRTFSALKDNFGDPVLTGTVETDTIQVQQL